MRPIAPLFVLLFFFLATSAQGDSLYRCVDEKGNLSIQDYPCAIGQKTDKVIKSKGAGKKESIEKKRRVRKAAKKATAAEKAARRADRKVAAKKAADRKTAAKKTADRKAAKEAGETASGETSENSDCDKRFCSDNKLFITNRCPGSHFKRQYYLRCLWGCKDAKCKEPPPTMRW